VRDGWRDTRRPYYRGRVSSRRGSLPALVLLILMIVWGGAVLAAPWLAAAPRGSLRVAMASGVYLAGGVVCHQRAERSFHAFGAQLPVCGRCQGVYAGAASAAALAIALGAVGRPGRRTTLATRSFMTIAALPTALSWTLEHLGWADGTPAIRAVLAVPLGVAVAVVAAAWYAPETAVPHEVN
jgi:uncharacterized membrane protein